MSQSTVPAVRLEPVNPQSQAEHFNTDSEVVRAPYLYCFLMAVFKPTCVDIFHPGFTCKIDFQSIHWCNFITDTEKLCA